jgi:hypothetical protein
MNLIVLCALALDWTEPVEVKKGKETAVTYRARFTGDWLVIEAVHGPGWHTYALDNKARAAKRAGSPPLGIEKPTEIAVSGDLEVAGKWRQSPPKDLSQPEIEWYTWGFEGTSYFAVRVIRAGNTQATLRIDAQACKASACAMADDVELRIPIGLRNANETSQVDVKKLVEDGDLSAMSAK